MTTHSKRYGFYFEKQGRGGYEGPNDPSAEHFTHVALEESLTREIIQNSLDAKAKSESAVTVEFELRTIASDQIPDIDRIRTTIDHALHASQDLQGRQYLQRARDCAWAPTVSVLRIGDYGTTGLTGSESIDEPHSPLSVLTRGRGVSSNDGNRGGSFGIGASVGLVASDLKTIAYISKARDKADVVFAALCKLASHKDHHGEWRLGSGYFTALDNQDFEYLREPAPIGDFGQRMVWGTDVYLFGYSEAENDPKLREILRACVRNFMVAIHRGALVVRGIADEGAWVLNSSSLAEFIDGDTGLCAEVRPFYRALTIGDCVTKELDGIGTVQLYTYVDDSLPKPLFTQVMRKPLMRVEVYQHRFHIPYAAIFICESEPGNTKLREIEPPTHNHWNTAGPRSDVALVSKIKRFVRDELAALMPHHYGEFAKIRGLEKFLPSDLQSRSEGTGNGRSAKPLERQPTESESAARLGRPYEGDAYVRRPDVSVSVPTSRAAIATPDGTSDGRRGERGGGGGSSDSERREIKAPANSGDGRSRISGSKLRFRSYFDNASRSTKIVIRAKESVEGDLELVALGGADADAFVIPIERAELETQNGPSPVEVKESTLLNLKLEEGQAATLRLTFVSHGRYRLGVRDV